MSFHRWDESDYNKMLDAIWATKPANAERQEQILKFSKMKTFTAEVRYKIVSLFNIYVLGKPDYDHTRPSKS